MNAWSSIVATFHDHFTPSGRRESKTERAARKTERAARQRQKAGQAQRVARERDAAHNKIHDAGLGG